MKVSAVELPPLNSAAEAKSIPSIPKQVSPADDSDAMYSCLSMAEYIYRNVEQ